MGSCVSKKDGEGKLPHPLPAAKDNNPPSEEEEEEVKEVLSETPMPRPRPTEQKAAILPADCNKRSSSYQEEEAEEVSEACSASESMSILSTAVTEKAGGEEVEQRLLVPEKTSSAARTRVKRREENDLNKVIKSLSPAASAKSSSQRRKQNPSLSSSGGDQLARSRREQAVVVSGIGCRSGRFSPSAAKRAAERPVRRTNSAREAEMMSRSTKRSLSSNSNGNGNAYSGSGIRRDPGERSARRSDSPAAKLAAANTVQRQGSTGSEQRRLPPQAVTKDSTVDQMKQPLCRMPRDSDGCAAGTGQAMEGCDGSGEESLAGNKEEGRLENPSVAMECFIFL